MKNKIIKTCKKIKNKIENNYFAKHNLEKTKMIAQKNYKNSFPITIISTNCIAGEIYNLLGLRFDSPTINCSFNRKDFVDFCMNLDYYISVEPKIISHINDSPVLILQGNNKNRDIYIHFPHDTEDQVVLQNWEKRKKRIHKDHIYIICDDRGIGIDEFNKLNKVNSFKTIIFTAKKYDIKNTYFIEKYKKKQCVGKYNVKSLKGTYKFQDYFDFVDWLNA